MYLKNLSIHQFKNHASSNLEFNEKLNCFVGDNGSGKTNILDAIHYLSLTKSYFNYIDGNNIQFGEKYFMLKGKFVKGEKIDDVECNVQETKGKTIKKNKKSYKRFSDHIGEFPLILVSPTDTNLIIEGSEARRKYLNSSIAQYDQNYLRNLINYNKILKQRNSLLKQFAATNAFDSTTLETYNLQLIKYGSKIYDTRKDFLRKLIPVFNKYYQEICQQKEQVNIEYRSLLNDNTFSELLRNSLEKDRYTQHTSCGIHKDDIIFKMDNYLIKKIGSQGQQKSFLIALKLAQFDFMNQELNFKPILLLDDIFDKLDDKRVEQLLRLVEENTFGQVFITDTDLERSQNILSSSNVSFRMFKIQDGKII